MIMHSILTHEIIFQGYPDFSPEYHEIQAGGVRLLVQPLSLEEGKVVRLISSDPGDYLDPALAPGATVRYRDLA